MGQIIIEVKYTCVCVIGVGLGERGKEVLGGGSLHRNLRKH